MAPRAGQMAGGKRSAENPRPPGYRNYERSFLLPAYGSGCDSGSGSSGCRSSPGYGNRKAFDIVKNLSMVIPVFLVQGFYFLGQSFMERAWHSISVLAVLPRIVK
jgi:hypothetical protein